MKISKIVAAAAMFAAPALAFAADGLSVSGHVDFGIAHSNRDNVAPGVSSQEDTFTNNQSSLFISKAPVNGFSGLINLVAGTDSNAVSSFGVGADVALAQGYVQYTSGGLTLTGGKFFTLAGYEVFATTGNAQVSRGLLFGVQPLSLTGVRASYAVNDMVSLTGGLVNGYSEAANTDGNEQKTLELGLGLAPAPGASLAFTLLLGNENTPNDSNSNSLLDIVGSWQVSKTFNLGLNLDIGKEETAGDDNKLTGVALYAGAQLTEKFKLSGRIESLKRDNGATDTTDSSITLTGGYAAAKNFDFLTELRLDDSESAGFTDDGVAEEKAATLYVKSVFKF